MFKVIEFAPVLVSLPQSDKKNKICLICKKPLIESQTGIINKDGFLIHSICKF